MTTNELVEVSDPGDVAPANLTKKELEPTPIASGKSTKLAPYFLILPAIGILLLALGYPLFWQLKTSMQQFGLAQQFGQPAKWVWFDNYIELFSDPYMWTVVIRSIAFCLIVASATMLAGVAIALLMKAVPGGVLVALQVALLLAWAMPVVAAMTIWTWLFDWHRGVINYVLVKMGFEQFAGHNWLANPLSFFIVAGIIVLWMSVPFVAFSVYAGLTQISEEVLEASSLDGASPTQQLWLIIMPMIKPVLGIVFLLQIIWDLRVFTQIKLLQDQGSIASETNLLGTYIYQLGVGAGNFSMASAVSVFVLLLTIALSAAYVRSLMKEDE